MMRTALVLLVLCSSLFAAKPNLLIITVDDMSCDSVGAYGCKLKDSTPNMDKLAAQSLRFNYAHTVVGNCMPSRNVMWSGKYPHNNHIEGFRAISKNDKDYPVLGDLMKDAGYFTGIRHKVSHSTPYSPFPWDLVLGDERHDDAKNPESWGKAATTGIEAAKKAEKPFCLLLNIADPHKPFYAEGKKGETIPDKNVPSKVFTPEEVPVPGFLPDDPIVRKELSHYYSSVRRADDGVGSILAALHDSGEDENTIIVFLSDHGMPLPFAKTQLYHHSTRTPLMIRWPGVTKPGAVDDEHMISTVDLLPTILDMLNIASPGGFDGSSFTAVLKGEKQPPGRTMIFKEHNENAGGQNTPMRAVQTKDFVYIFSPWSNGTRVMSGATNGTSTCRQMRVLARTNEQIAARIDLFDHRVPEEAYEVSYDPDALTNLIAKPENATQVADLEKAMEDWMVKTKDPLLEVFRHRDDAAFREQFVKQLESKQMNKQQRTAANRAAKESSAPAKPEALIVLEVPATITPGQKATVKLTHHFPADLGEKSVQVTLKGGDNSRIERKQVKASGDGVIEVTFDIPATVPGGKVIFAALVGNGIKDALQHLQARPVAVK
ncbi:MAG: sulfatase [Prosthecobacter sp.]|uniref:sulfatase family protein n=1 Tax=Prosthecobacter sp. TaxID=1965333 RepID=UPI00260C9C24|nr:sulfatase [Prosthecobacter sp.]MCF7790317.1 sulfatase [Prosthecobacter sp.]